MAKEKKINELEQVVKALKNYSVKYNGNCDILCVVNGFDKKSNVINDRIFVHGSKAELKILIKELKKVLDEEEGDFIHL